LAPLAILLRRWEPEIPQIVRRFSNGAVPAVAALVLTGTALAWIQVRHPAALLATAYGQILSIKLALVAVLFVLAGINRYRLTPTLGRAGVVGRLSASAFAELVLAAAIFGLVGLWRFTPPPRAVPVGTPADHSAVVHFHTPEVMAEVTLLPGRAGPTRIRIVFNGASGPLEPKDVTIRLSNKPAGVETIERRAVRGNERIWSVEGVALPVAGRWELEVETLISDFEKATLVGEIAIRP
jgi:copper transport protein